MAQPTDRTQLPEWIDDARAEPRWRDVRTVLARLGANEFLGKTRDLSWGGVGLALHGAQPGTGDPIELDVVFGAEIRAFRGHVIHSASKAWGSLLGVRREGGDASLEEFLARRYAPGSTGPGNVT